MFKRENRNKESNTCSHYYLWYRIWTSFAQFKRLSCHNTTVCEIDVEIVYCKWELFILEQRPYICLELDLFNISKLSFKLQIVYSKVTLLSFTGYGQPYGQPGGMSYFDLFIQECWLLKRWWNITDLFDGLVNFLLCAINRIGKICTVLWKPV